MASFIWIFQKKNPLPIFLSNVKISVREEAGKQLSNIETYEEVSFSEHDFSDLVDRSNDCFLEVKRKDLITEKSTSVLLISLRKLLIWVNSVFFPKYTKTSSMSTEEASEFLDHHLQRIMKPLSLMLKTQTTFQKK